jgi:hypothetical protein
VCTRQGPTARIRFAERLRKTCKFTNFADVAERCAREDQSILPNEEKRPAAFDLLACDLLDLKFEKAGRSQVLFLHPRSTMKRMTPELLRDVIKHDIDSHGGRSYLEYCWFPQWLFKRWLSQNNLPESRFEPLLKQSPVRPKRKKARPDFDRAKAAITALYPNGPPDKVAIPNKTLCRRVSEKLEESHPELPPVSNDTILRAASRRK